MACLVVEQVNRAAKGVARFQFDEICNKILGPADYFAVANAFRVVVVTDVPDFSLQARLSSLYNSYHSGHACPQQAIVFQMHSALHGTILADKHVCSRCGTVHGVSSPWLM